MPTFHRSTLITFGGLPAAAALGVVAAFGDIKIPVSYRGGPLIACAACNGSPR